MQQPVDISNCEKEPIHIPGKIQAHGFLLVIHRHSLRILQASANLSDFTDLTAHDAIGLAIHELVPEHSIQFVLELMDKGDSDTLNPLQVNIVHNGKEVAYNCITNQAPGVWLMEFEPAASSSIELVDQAFHLLPTINTRLRKTDNVRDLGQTVCDEVRSYTQYDRVMLYRFDADWNGEVVAEARSQEVHSFVGHHYPASDIPRQARELFFRNPIRIIPNVEYTPAALIPEKTASDIDMTYSVLRNVSPIHIQYLKNMGVAASLTISVIVDNRLWGMIACHHRTPIFVDYNKRKVCELIGRMFSSHLLLKEELEGATYAKRIQNNTEELYQQMYREMSIVNGIRNGDQRWLHSTGAEGVAINYQGRIYTLGTTPAPEQIDRLYHWLSQQPFNDIYYTNSLQQHFPSAVEFAGTASGVLVTPISRSSEEYVVWFRPELVKTIHWAGNPDKAAAFDPATMQLSPRQSFEVWKQIVYGVSAPWKNAEINNALLLHMHIQEVMLREYRQIGREAGTNRSQQQSIEIQVLERTIELKHRQMDLQKQLELSQQQQQQLRYEQLISNGMVHLLRNHLANISLYMSQSIASFLGDIHSQKLDAGDVERTMQRLLECSHKFTALSRMEYHSLQY